MDNIFSLSQIYENCFKASNGSKCEIIYLNDDKSSWLILIKEYFKNVEIDFDLLWNLHPEEYNTIRFFDKEIKLPRYTNNYGVDYRFSGTIHKASSTPNEINIIMQNLQKIVMGNNKSLLNGCLVNWYADGNHYIGPHSDSERGIYSNSPILTLSLGATRTFKLIPKEFISTQYRKDLKVNNGDLLIMGGTTQSTHKHTIPKTKKCKDRRISITMRCFK